MQALACPGRGAARQRCAADPWLPLSHQARSSGLHLAAALRAAAHARHEAWATGRTPASGAHSAACGLIASTSFANPAATIAAAMQI